MLVVALDCSTERGPVALAQPTSLYVDRLEVEGYRYIKLQGLGQVSARDVRGLAIDDYFVSIETDVQLLLDHYLALEDLAANHKSNRVWTYIADGCFEFSTVVVGAIAYVRVGIFRDSAFKAPFADGVKIALHCYVLMWRSVAEGILAGAEGRIKV